MRCDERNLPVEDLRGVDPHLFDERGNHATVLVNAPCEAVAEALSKHSSMTPEIEDVLAGAVASDRERAVLIFQLRGHHWTQIDARDHYVLELAEYLSRELGAQAFMYIFQDVTGGYGYSIYGRGELVESFSDIDLSGFGADVVEGNREQATENGCLVNSSGRICFFTKRDTKLDVESTQECEAIMEKVAKELGIYVAADVLFVGDAGCVECWHGWSPGDLQAAKLVMAVDQEAKYQAWLADHLDEETAKLDIKEDKESFERMQRMLAGELPMNVPAEFEDIFRQCEEKLAQLKQREPDSL